MTKARGGNQKQGKNIVDPSVTKFHATTRVVGKEREKKIKNIKSEGHARTELVFGM